MRALFRQAQVEGDEGVSGVDLELDSVVLELSLPLDELSLLELDADDFEPA
jgi:hypothetical protein